MDSKAFAKVLAEYAKRRPTLSQDFDLWTRIAFAFGGAKKETVGSFLTRVSSAEVKASGGDALYQIRYEVAILAAFAQSLGKDSLADAFSSLARTIETNPSLTVEALEIFAAPVRAATTRRDQTKKTKVVEPADAAVIAVYLKRLDESLGDEQGFAEVLNALENDKRLKLADYKSLAKSFSGATGSSKKKALEAIERRNRLLIDARVRSEMNAGKTAA
jgi:hypothetical protein